MTNFNNTREQARALWVKALRSGNYEQTQGALHRIKEKAYSGGGTDAPAGYCCLGVACDLYQKHEGGLDVDMNTPDGETNFNDESSFLPAVVQDWLGLADHSGAYMYEVDVGDLDDMCEDSLADKNDADASFTDIADIIESNPVGLFD